MNDVDLDKVGNANLRRPDQQLTIKKEQQNSPSNLGVDSFIDTNNYNVQIFNVVDHSKCPPYPHQKCVKIINARWDKFSAYSFHKLNQLEKDRTFLQLYQDFQQIKAYLNNEMLNNKKLQAKLQSKQTEIAKLKAMTPAQRSRYSKQKSVSNNTQVASLKQQIKRLHQKIIALTGNKFSFQSKSKARNDGKTKIVKTVDQNLRGQLDNQRKYVRQLLLIIDELKKNKFLVEQQLRNTQSNASQIRPVKNQSKMVGKGNTESQFYQFSNQLHMWKQKYNDLQLVYNRMNEDKDKKIRQLSSELIVMKQNEKMRNRLNRRQERESGGNQKMEEQIRKITQEKQRLENQLLRIVKIPFYQDNKQIMDAQQKITSVQSKYQKMKEQLSKLNQTNTKNFAELQFKIKQNALLKTQNQKYKKQIKETMQKQYAKTADKINYVDYDDYYRKKLALVELEGNDPVWKKYESLAKPQIKKMSQENVKILAETLWLNKLQLLAHVQKAQVELKMLKDGMDSRVNLYIRQNEALHEELKIARARLDEWRSMENLNQRKLFKVYEQSGIKYDDTVSVFDTQQTQMKQLDSNQNYFDLYLGYLNIDENVLMANPLNKVKNTSHFISFLTVDFYNHETQHSNFGEGVTKKLANNYSFKVQVNSPFLKYLSKKTMSLELWSPQGTATVLLGKGQIYLSQLITKSAQDISAVIRGKCQIYSNQKTLIATVQYRLRMRLPISPFIEWAQNNNQFKTSEAKDPFALGKKRTLQISIQHAEGIPVGMNSFVYFNIQQEDYFTQTERGPTPYWNFRQNIDLTMDQQLIDELKQKYFQFTVFDDDKEINNDVYGIVKANFTPLIDATNVLDLVLDIQDINGNKKGRLKIQAQWMT